MKVLTRSPKGKGAVSLPAQRLLDPSETFDRPALQRELCLPLSLSVPDFSG